MIILVKDKETNEVVATYECQDYDIEGKRIEGILFDYNVYLEEQSEEETEENEEPIDNEGEAQDE